MKRIKPISRGGVKRALVGQGVVLDLLEKVLGGLVGQMLEGKNETDPVD